MIERCYVDTVGVSLAGVSEGAGKRAAALCDVVGDASGASVLGTGQETTVTQAALVNGISAHALDYDDFTYAYPLHPSAVLVVPVLALAEQDWFSGRDAIAAYAAGFETIYYLTAPISRVHYERGWHATGTIGTFGAAAAASWLIDLDAESTQRALNIVASTPSGLIRNFGTQTKPLHPGLAARSGVTAALLAREGFSADSRAISGDRGFFDLYCGEDDINHEMIPTLGDPWGLVHEGVTAKKYPSCGATHSSIEAASMLADDHGIGPDDVDHVHVEVAPFAADALRISRPESGLQAKFSMEYCVASAIVHDRVGLKTFEDDAITDETVQALFPRIEVVFDGDLAYNDHRSTVTIDAGGNSYVEAVEHPPGGMENPLTPSELEAKFLECATRTVRTPAAERAFERLSNLRDVNDLNDVIATTQP